MRLSSKPGDRVLDAYALLAFFQGEKGASRVASALAEAEKGRCLLSISMINVAEVFYRLCKCGMPEAAESFLEHLKRGEIPVETVSATDRRVLSAARLKAGFRLSLADAFAAGLAAEKGVPVLTGDPEFRALVEAGVVDVEWL